MYIINYSSGGLGNRLKPMGTCFNIAKETNRKLAMVWKPTLRCNCNFEDIFDNIIEKIDLDSLNPEEVSIYSDPGYISHDANLNGDYSFLNLFKKTGICNSLDDIKNIKYDIKKYIIIYNNTTTPGYDDIKEFLVSLEPKSDIKEKVNAFSILNSIDKNVIGVHARCTDFNLPYTYYLNLMNTIDQNLKMFVCSDSKEFEEIAKDMFGSRVIIRIDKKYVYKQSSTGTWTNNVSTPTDVVKDSLVDLYILTNTNFVISHPDSTFAHLVKILN